MYYHISYRPEKQLASLKGKFRNEALQKKVFVFLYSQTQQELRFVMIAPINPDVVMGFEDVLKESLVPSLYFLIGEHIDLNRIDYYELSRDQLSRYLNLSTQYVADFDDLLTLGNAFFLNLTEYSSAFSDHYQDDKSIEIVSSAIERIDFSKNVFLINSPKDLDINHILSELIRRLIEHHLALSAFYFQMSLEPYTLYDQLIDIKDPSFIRAALGKTVVIRIDNSKQDPTRPLETSLSLVLSVNQLSKRVPVILVQETQLTDRAARIMSEQFGAYLVEI